MRVILAPLLLCAGCGFGPFEHTNNALEGSWVAQTPVATMELRPGPAGVVGQGTVQSATDGHVATYSIETLPDEHLQWTLTNGAANDPATLNFGVHVVSFCPGQPLPDVGHTYEISLDGTLFFRKQLPPVCDPFFGP
jgi:hypothetical protein